MLLVAQILAAIVLLLHVYFVLLETVLFRTRGAKVFGVPKDQIDMRAAAMSNQGCYNGFLVAAIALGFFYPDAAIARAFMTYGLVCVVVAGVWGAATVSKRILYIQALPAALALIAFFSCERLKPKVLAKSIFAFDPVHSFYVQSRIRAG